VTFVVLFANLVGSLLPILFSPRPELDPAVEAFRRLSSEEIGLRSPFPGLPPGSPTESPSSPSLALPMRSRWPS